MGDDPGPRRQRGRFRLAVMSGCVASVIAGAEVSAVDDPRPLTLSLWGLAAVLSFGYAYWDYRANRGPSEDALPVNLTQALRATASFYDYPAWTSRAIELRARTSTDATASAAELLRRHALDPATSVLLLTGRFGSGKTWLLRRLARDLANRLLSGNRETPIPLFISLSALVSAHLTTRDDLLRAVAPQPIVSADLPPGSPVLLLLDGLDELMARGQASPGHAEATLRTVASLLAPPTRYVVSCRTEARDVVDITSTLLPQLSYRDPADRTSDAVARARGSPPGRVAQVELLDVTSSQADTYLSTSAAIWNRVRDQRPYRDLTLCPATLFLLEETLPELADETFAPRLSDVYKAAVDAWFFRQGVTDNATLQNLYDRLEQLAVGLIFPDVVPPDDTTDDMIRATGLVTSNALGEYEFRHFSFVDYFLARALVHECINFSSSLLGRLNLVAMYNVHRFAVPMLLDEACTAGGRTVPMIEGAWVSGDAFETFIADTGWRREGYGLWPALRRRDGALPFDRASSGGLAPSQPAGEELADWGVTPSSAERDAAITGISWYDSVTFCRYSARRLLAADEAISRAASYQGDPEWEWTSSWYRERDGLISVVERATGDDTPRLIGLNPDLRSRKIGFRAVQRLGSG